MNKPKLTNDQQKEVIQRYLNGEMVADLKEEFGCSDTTIYKLLRETNNVKRGLDIRYATQEQKDKIVKLYIDGNSCTTIAKKYTCSHHVILDILEQQGIPRDAKRFHRKYQLNEHYFDVIDTPNKAYILGLLHADGCNKMDKGTISIALQESDKDLLETIRLEIESEKPLRFIDNSNKHTFGYTYENMYELQMFSVHMCEQLADKGIVPNKSLVIGFPEWLDDNLISHYVRGVFDGDGTITQTIVNENNKPTYAAIVGTDLFCQSLKVICNEILNINPSIYDSSCHNGITKVISFTGKQKSKIFLDWIYQDAEIFLQRKYDRYCKYYNINNSLIA